MIKDDKYWMNLALKEAHKAARKNEVPVGAIVVANDQIVGRGHNLREKLNTPLAHAETIALHRAAKKIGSWRLNQCTLYVTLEPCLMCSGVIIQSRIPRLVYGASDPKAGAVDSLYKVLNDSRLNHQVEVKTSVMAEECKQLLKSFFKNLRQLKKTK